MKRAVEDDCDFIWGMDDDAYPQPDALWNLLDASRSYDINNTAFYSNSYSYLIKYEKGKLESVRGWTFVGFGISQKMIKKIGYPRSDLFIFYDDYEYGQRIVNNGYTIIKVHDSIIVHEGALNTFNGDSYYRRKFLTKEITVRIIPEWKIYYLMRNYILTAHSFKKKLRAICSDLKYGVKLIYVKPNMQSVWTKGFLDGIRGKSGIVFLPK